LIPSIKILFFQDIHDKLDLELKIFKDVFDIISNGIIYLNSIVISGNNIFLNGDEVLNSKEKSYIPSVYGWAEINYETSPFYFTEEGSNHRYSHLS
jgi:hypothetical protein